MVSVSHGRYLLPEFGALPLDRISTHQVRAWLAGMSAAGLGPSRVRNAYRLLSGILRAATEADFLARTPCVGVRLPCLPRKEMVILSRAQIRALSEAMPPRYRALVSCSHAGPSLGRSLCPATRAMRARPVPTADRRVGLRRERQGALRSDEDLFAPGCPCAPLHRRAPRRPLGPVHQAGRRSPCVHVGPWWAAPRSQLPSVCVGSRLAHGRSAFGL